MTPIEPPLSPAELKAILGDMDIQLIDQLLRGNLPEPARVLDAGCGGGRNLHYFLSRGFDVSAADVDAGCLVEVRELARRHGQPDNVERFHLEPVERMTFPAGYFDLVICNAVLHFARDETHFQDMIRALWRVTRSGGLCFCRLATLIGMETLAQPHANTMPGGAGWYRLPDGTDRFLIDLDYLLRATATLGVQLTDPIKTVQVQNLRSMTTWVWRRSPGS